MTMTVLATELLNKILIRPLFLAQGFTYCIFPWFASVALKCTTDAWSHVRMKTTKETICQQYKNVIWCEYIYIYMYVVFSMTTELITFVAVLVQDILECCFATKALVLVLESHEVWQVPWSGKHPSMTPGWCIDGRSSPVFQGFFLRELKQRCGHWHEQYNIARHILEIYTIENGMCELNGARLGWCAMCRKSLESLLKNWRESADSARWMIVG